MKTKIITPLIIILSVLILQSCYTPQNTVKLQPESKEGSWRYGQQFIVDSLYGITYEVSFNRCQDNLYYFDFSVTNQSNLPILIDPASFLYQAYDASFKSTEEGFVQAIDPEKELERIQKSLASTENFRKNQLGLSLLAAGVDIATRIAAVSDDNPRNDRFRTHFFEGVQFAGTINAAQAEDLDNSKQRWENATIRKTTLAPNYNIRGKVFFPASPDATYIKLFLPVDAYFIKMNFKQVHLK